VMRTIEIRGDQTLEDLHDAIYNAFDRERSTSTSSSSARSRGGVAVSALRGDVHPGLRRWRWRSRWGDVAETKMDDLGLKTRQSFGYWFDFGDDWYHELKVKAIGEAQPGVVYPRVTESIGDSPPQYLYWMRRMRATVRTMRRKRCGGRGSGCGAGRDRGPPRLPLVP